MQGLHIFYVISLLLFATSNEAMFLLITRQNPEWFTCERANDCGLFIAMCGNQLPANKQYLDEAQDAFCKATDCTSANCFSLPPIIPICVQGRCVAE